MLVLPDGAPRCSACAFASPRQDEDGARAVPSRAGGQRHLPHGRAGGGGDLRPLARVLARAGSKLVNSCRWVPQPHELRRNREIHSRRGQGAYVAVCRSRQASRARAPPKAARGGAIPSRSLTVCRRAPKRCPRGPKALCLLSPPSRARSGLSGSKAPSRAPPPRPAPEARQTGSSGTPSPSWTGSSPVGTQLPSVL